MDVKWTALAFAMYLVNARMLIKLANSRSFSGLPGISEVGARCKSLGIVNQELIRVGSILASRHRLLS